MTISVQSMSHVRLRRAVTEAHPSVLDLYGPDSLGVFGALAILCVHWGMAWAVSHTNVLVVFLAAFFIGQLTLHSAGALIHESAHRLILRSDRDAWVQCFYRQADRRWIKIYPNAYQPKARLAARRPETVPADNQPFDLTVAGPIGAELVKCFATTRDVTAELPAGIDADTKPLEPGSERQILAAFERLTDAGLSEASLVVTVTR